MVYVPMLLIQASMTINNDQETIQTSVVYITVLTATYIQAEQNGMPIPWRVHYNMIGLLLGGAADGQ